MSKLRRALSSLRQRSRASAAALAPRLLRGFLLPSYDLRDWRQLGQQPALIPIPLSSRDRRPRPLR